jgi:hypothetical protein
MMEKSYQWEKPDDAWKVEAADINIFGISDKEFTEYFVVKQEVNEFLSAPNKKIIMAPKGYGKTLFLRKKALFYKTIQHRGETFPIGNALCEDGKNQIIPLAEDNMFRKNYFISNDDLKRKSHLSQKITNIMLAWEYAFIMAAREYIKESKKEESIEKQPNNLTLSFFREALMFSPKAIYKILHDKECMKFNQECYIFIDNIDLMVKFGYDAKIEENSWDVPVDISVFQFWTAIQLGFCLAITELPLKHIHICGAVRHEALSLLDENYFEYADRSKLTRLVTKLDYTKQDIEKIFFNNISLAMDSTPISVSERSEKLKYYYGIRNPNIINRVVNRKEEKLFDYIYRHTLWKPRDIMLIGNEIKNVKQNNTPLKRAESIQRKVHDNGIYKNIVGEYLTEIGSSLQGHIKDLSLYSEAIPNILTYNELKSICRWLNKISVSECPDCSKCKAEHYFCFLFNSGLLGIENWGNGKVYQKFQLPHERGDVLTWGMKSIHKFLHKNYFFVHPLLYNRANFKINTKVLIGNEIPFFTSINVKSITNETKKYRLSASLCSDWEIKVVIDELTYPNANYDLCFKSVGEFKRDVKIIELLGLDNIKVMAGKLKKLELNSFTESIQIVK